MDFPAAEKCYSHVSQRRPSDSSSESSTDHSPIDYSQETKALSPTTSRISQPALTRDLTRITTNGTGYDPAFEVDFEDDDPRDPKNWPLLYKAFVLFSVAFGTLTVVMYSTSYTSALGAMEKEFNVHSDSVATLGVTTYLLGLAVGSLVLAPISETYGRKPVYMIAMFLFFILVLPCARATSMEAIIIVRFFGAVAGSAMISNAPGTIGDVIEERHRPVAFSIWSIGPMNGPVIGPVMGGFVTEYLGWRWTNWVVMIAGGIAFGFMVLIKETYAPALLQQMAKKKRKQEEDERYWSRYDVRVGFAELMRVNLSRPFVMAAKESICIFWNVYIGIIYGILYLCFVAYPIVFTQDRGWSPGFSGLSFLGIGIGTMITICSAKFFTWMIDSHKPGPDGKVPPESMMSVVCIAAVLIPVGELWFAWTCYPTTIHWAASIAAGIPFGAGNGIVFIYASNYLVHSYGIYAASALAGNAVIRSVLGGTLPLAGQAMYKKLGPNWAGTLLGLLEVAIIPIPFIFYRYGHKIREKSTLIRQMREDEERQQRKRKRAEERLRLALEKSKSRGAAAPDTMATLEEMSSRQTSAITDIEKEAEVELDRVQGFDKI